MKEGASNGTDHRFMLGFQNVDEPRGAKGFNGIIIDCVNCVFSSILNLFVEVHGSPDRST
jgi:hypothetical protein